MGICNSCESTSVASAMLILEDGRLQEVSYPVTVSQILQANPGCFVSNAADMELDDFIPAVHEEYEIQMGQLYFVLPLSWQNSRLRAEKMAALAAKASLALGSRGGYMGLRRRKRAIPGDLMASSDRVTEEASPLVDLGRAQRRGRVGGGKAKELTTTLHIIVEE